MRILYFHQHFITPSATGGTRSYEIARRLIQRGHQVTMVCGEARGFKLPNGQRIGRRLLRQTIDGIDIIQMELPYSNYLSFPKRTVAFLRFALTSIWLALKLDYDLLFATSTPLTAALPGIVMKLFRRKPFVFEVRDLWPELPKAMGVIKNPLILWMIGCLEWMAYHSADAMIALSPGMQTGMQKRSRPNMPITMIPNSSDLDLFRPGQRTDLNVPGIKATDIVAAFTGAHGLANGTDAILDAAACLKNHGRHDIKLLFVGDGKLKPHLKQRAQNENLDNCIFLDPLPKLELQKLIGSVDIGLMVMANVPAFYYGTSPNKFFDYISAGLPIFNNYPGWLADMINEHQCGLVVPPDDPEAFAQGLIQLAGNPAGRRQMGINARRLAESQFDRDQLATRFAEWLELAHEKYYQKTKGEGSR